MQGESIHKLRVTSKKTLLTLFKRLKITEIKYATSWTQMGLFHPMMGCSGTKPALSLPDCWWREDSPEFSLQQFLILFRRALWSRTGRKPLLGGCTFSTFKRYELIDSLFSKATTVDNKILKLLLWTRSPGLQALQVCMCMQTVVAHSRSGKCSLRQQSLRKRRWGTKKLQARSLGREKNGSSISSSMTWGRASKTKVSQEQTKYPEEPDPQT